ncbi:MAG TPA: hypothetical protein VNA04_10725 [Thermoanaerobaculia bacterium]|nr:hypothetical protein [Thermoanaerobaculia bacterium]
MKRVLPAILILLYPLAAHGWTRAGDERIARKAAQLAPPDLRLMIERFEPEYKQGLARAQSDEGSDWHRHFPQTGRLRQRIEAETAGAIAMLRGGEPMSSVVERLGMLAHFMADANNPFHVSNDDPRLAASQLDYKLYFERRLARFPTVFYGLDPSFQLGPYLDRTFSRTARFYPLIREEYFRFGQRRSSAEFDDRSTAFGIASISYSRAVSDLVNLYYFIWREAGGDVRSAPLMRGSNLVLNAN